jgi:hypothetical protein
MLENQIEVRTVIGTKGDGTPRYGRKWVARDSDHAGRIIARQKARLEPGSSTYFTRHAVR